VAPPEQRVERQEPQALQHPAQPEQRLVPQELQVLLRREQRARPPPERPVTTAPAPPPARQASARRAEEDYMLQVIRKLSRVRYRPTSRVASDSGVVVTRVTVARDGRLLDVALTRSSGSPDLDRGLLESVRRASPFAPLPADVDGQQLSFLLPIQYSRER
jgi:TonB family protein